MHGVCGITGIRVLETNKNNNMKAAKQFELLLVLNMSYSTVKHTILKVFHFFGASTLSALLALIASFSTSSTVVGNLVFRLIYFLPK